MSESNALGDTDEVVLVGTATVAVRPGGGALAVRGEAGSAATTDGERTTTRGSAGQDAGASSARAGRRAHRGARRPRPRRTTTRRRA